MEYSGRFNSKGQPHGTGQMKFFDSNGELALTFKGTFLNGKKSGMGMFETRGGEISYITYDKNGLPDGVQIYFSHATNQAKVRVWKNGELNIKL